MEKKFTLVLGIILLGISLIAQSEIRTYDGSNNNLLNPEWGASHTQLRRVAPADYGDNISTPAGANRLNPRKISNTLFSQVDSNGDPLLINDHLSLSDYTWVFGQLLDHDITLSENNDEPAMISVDFPDAHFNPGGAFPNTVIPMNRNKVMEGTGTNLGNPREHINEITAWIDGSSVYGSDAFRANWLRTMQGGKLKVSTGNLLPYNTISGEFDDDVDIDAPFMADDVGFAQRLFIAGDIRANENALLTSFHTIFHREHNRVCDDLAIQHPNWSDEQLYQHARKIIGGFIQSITYEEWLPSMGVAITPYTGYRATVNPSIFNVFSGAAFRMGHTLLSGSINMVDIDGTPHPEGPLKLRNAFFNPAVVAKEGVGPFLKGMGIQIQQGMDAKVVDDVRNFLFGPPGSGGLDLAAININRGRERGLPDLNTVRDAFGLTRYTSFFQIVNDLDVVAALEEMYDLNDIDPWVGMLAEAQMDNSLFGETVTAILQRQFQGLRDGDRFYYENDRDLSVDEKEMIKKTKFSEIIMRNTNIDLMQDNVFEATAHQEICGFYGKDADLWGDVLTASNQRVDGVSVTLSTASNEPIMNDIIDGAFSLAGIPTCEEITMTISKEDTYQNGVSTLDMILILKQIVGLTPFDSPYKYIAADVNNSGAVTTADIVAIRKVILGIENTFPNNTPWRFIAADYTFPNPNNPFTDDFPESAVVFLSQDDSQDFVAIKVGDVNQSADRSAAIVTNQGKSRSKETMFLELEDMDLVAGETYTIPIKGIGDQKLTGYQFTLKDNQSTLEFIRVNSRQLSEQNVGLINDGTLTASYHGLQYFQVEDLSFELTFTARQNARLSNVLNIQSNPTPSEAYNEQLEAMGIEFQFITNPTLQVKQNQPNPFSEWTTIGFDVPVTGFVELEVTDLTGKQLYTLQNEYPKGYNEIQINRSDITGSGVLYYHIKTAVGSTTNKMIVID